MYSWSFSECHGNFWAKSMLRGSKLSWWVFWSHFSSSWICSWIQCDFLPRKSYCLLRNSSCSWTVSVWLSLIFDKDLSHSCVLVCLALRSWMLWTRSCWSFFKVVRVQSECICIINKNKSLFKKHYKSDYRCHKKKHWVKCKLNRVDYSVQIGAC